MFKIKRQQAAGANCSAMEQRPFQKRVQLKNQRSRNNFLIKWTKETIFMFLITITTVVLLYGCDEQTEIPTTAINGVVIDISSKGVYAASVEYGIAYDDYHGSHFDSKKITTSNSDGIFEFKDVNADLSTYSNKGYVNVRHCIKISKDGYIDNTKYFERIEAGKTTNIAIVLSEKGNNNRIYGNVKNSYNNNSVAGVTVEYGVHYRKDSLEYYDLIERVFSSAEGSYEFQNVKTDLSDYKQYDIYRHYIKISKEGFIEKTEYIKVKTEEDTGLDILIAPANIEPYLPILTTSAVTVFTATTATFGGNITYAGTPEYIERGVCYSTTPTPTVENNKIVVSGTGTGSFSVNAAGLIEDARYYVRAYAINSLGTVYGNEVSFVPVYSDITIYTFTETFEIGVGGAMLAGWNFVNGSNSNKWYVGTATAYEGNGSCYISYNSSSYSAYSGVSSAVHFYRDFNFNSTVEEPSIISFHWKNMASNYLTVHLVEPSVTPVAGTTLSNPLVQLGNYSSWQQRELILPVMSGKKRLVFSWRNISGGSGSSPGAIDNIMVTNVILE